MADVSDEVLQEQLRRTRLRFPRGLEERFRLDYLERSLGPLRIAIAVGFLLFIFFAGPDLLAFRETRRIFLARTIFACVLFGVACGVTYVRALLPRLSWLVMGATLIGGLGVVFIQYFLLSHGLGAHHFAGFIIMLMWIYTMSRLRFVQATVVGWIVVVAYEIILARSLGVPGLTGDTEFLVNVNYYLLSAQVIGMLACYFMELCARKDFLQRLCLAEDQRKMEDEKMELVRQKENLDDELAMVRHIQFQLIPQRKPDPRMHALYIPMAPVGGDFYDFIPFDDPDRVGIFISDVAGHGVPAALITAMVKSFIMQSREVVHDPALLLTHLNRMLFGQTDGNFVTAFYCIFDRKTGVIRYSSAGHHPPYVIDAGDRAPYLMGVRRVSVLDNPMGIPLAIFPEHEFAAHRTEPYANREYTLPRGGKLLLYTDGLTEAKSADGLGRIFEDVIEEIMAASATLPGGEFLEKLHAELVAFHGSENFDDDVCVLCVDVAG